MCAKIEQWTQFISENHVTLHNEGWSDNADLRFVSDTHKHKNILRIVEIYIKQRCIKLKREIQKNYLDSRSRAGVWHYWLFWTELFTWWWAEQGSWDSYGSVYPDTPAPRPGHNNNIYQERLKISFICTSDPGSTVTVRVNENNIFSWFTSCTLPNYLSFLNSIEKIWPKLGWFSLTLDCIILIFVLLYIYQIADRSLTT